MKLNNLDLLNSYLALNVLGKEKLPIMLSYQIEVIRSYIEPFAKTVDNMIFEIKKRHALTDKSTGDFLLARDNSGNIMQNAFLLDDEKETEKEINEFLIQEIELPSVKLKLSLFPNDFKISADVLKSMKGIIEL